MIDRTTYEQVLVRATKDTAFRQELVSNPRAVLARDYHVHIAEGISIQVLEDQPDTFTLVLPASQEVVSELSDAELEVAAGGYRFTDTPHTDPLCTPHQD